MAEPTAYPVVEISRDLVKLWDAFQVNDERIVQMPEGPECNRLERENEAIIDRRRALDALVATTRAASLQGAMLQVAVAKDEADAIASYRPERYANIVDEHKRRVEACLHSVMRLLEELSGTPRETVGADHYMSRDFDPHPALIAALSGEPIPPEPVGAGTDE